MDDNPASGWLQQAIAYSALGGTAAPFGNSAAAALLDDMTDLGGARGAGLGDSEVEGLAPPLVMFAGSLAMAAAVDTGTDGFLTYDADAHTLTADFSDELWNFDYVEDDVIAARDALLSSLAEDAGAESFAQFDILSDLSSYIDGITFAVATSGIEYAVPAATFEDEEDFYIQAFVGTSYSDTIEGSAGFDLIFGGVGAGDEITDTEGGAYIVGSNSADEIFNGSGGTWGGGGNDTLTGGADNFGGDGNDLITGGTLGVGGAGNDQISGCIIFYGGDGADEFHITDPEGIVNIVFVDDPEVTEEVLAMQDGSYVSDLLTILGLWGLGGSTYVIVNADAGDSIFIDGDHIAGATYDSLGTTANIWAGSEMEQATAYYYGYQEDDLTYTTPDAPTSYLQVADSESTIARIFGFEQGIAGIALSGDGPSYIWSYPGGAPEDANPTSGTSGQSAIDDDIFYQSPIPYAFEDHMWV